MKTRGYAAKGIVVLLCMMLVLGAALPVWASGLVDIQDSVLPVLTLELVRKDQAVVGEEFSVVYQIKNISTKPAFGLEYKFEIVGTDVYNPFTIVENPAVIEQLDPGATATLTVKFKVADASSDVREKTYRIRGSVTCKDATFGTTLNYDAITDIAVGFTTAKPNLLVSNIEILGENPDSQEGFTARLTLKNTSLVYDLRNISLQLDGGENFEIMDISNKKEISRIYANESSVVDFKLRSVDGRLTNTATLTTGFSYTSGTVTDEEETLFLPLPTESSTVGKVPRVIIKRYSLSKEQVLAGDRVDLTLIIENTNNRPVRNVLINFGVESIVSDSGSSSSSSTVFAPVNSSNTFHIAEIKGKSTVSNTVTFSVDPGAAAKTYIVPVSITYEDETGTQKDLSVKDNVNIPVTQEAKISVTNMVFPTSAMVGSPAAVMAEFVNSGKVDISDFAIRLEGDFELMDASLYQAKLSIGSTKSYTGMLIAHEEGAKEGTLYVSYLDNNNQTVEESYPFTVEVAPAEDFGMMDPGMGGEFPDGMPVEEEGNAVVRFLKGNWLAVGLAAIVIGQLIYILRMKKKAKEEFFDE